MEYPVVETKEERATIDAYMADFDSHLNKAKSRFEGIMRDLGRPTRMVVPRVRNWFVPFHREKVTFGILKAHHYRNVLLVALRLRRRPEDILALWQNEGLPGWYKDEDEVSGRFYPLGNWYKHEPRDESQARAWAISCVLWERWGLDKLTSHSGRKNDNAPKASSADEHIKAFESGFATECATYLKDSPYKYLSDPAGAIELKNDTGLWRFRTRPQYQTTALVLQTARFKSQVKRIPAFYKNLDVPVFTRTVFPAALYMHYNSKYAEQHLFRLAKMMVAADRKAHAVETEYDGDDIWRFFTTTVIPSDVEKEVPRMVGGVEYLNGHAWVNALRFEFIRQVYADLFAEFKIEEMQSIFLIDE